MQKKLLANALVLAFSQKSRFKFMKNLEKNYLTSRVERDHRFELSATPEGREIREVLEKEYQRRIAILNKALDDLKIPKELIIISPPVLDRTDFGYNTDLDIIFLGEEEQGSNLYNRLYKEGEFLATVDHYGPERLREIERALPELYDFLMRRRGNILVTDPKLAEGSGWNFWGQAEKLEAKARTLLGPEEKEQLREQRLAIGKQFVDEARQKANVVAYAFSGSMLENMERFGAISDLDIDLVIDSPDPVAKSNALDWVYVYLKWKYTEEYGIKVDIFPTELNDLKQMAALDSDMADFYKRIFGIDLLEKKS